jgi:hypothetical protein
MEYFCKATEKGKLIWVGFHCHEFHFCIFFASFAMVHKTWMIAFSSSYTRMRFFSHKKPQLMTHLTHNEVCNICHYLISNCHFNIIYCHYIHYILYIIMDETTKVYFTCVINCNFCAKKFTFSYNKYICWLKFHTWSLCDLKIVLLVFGWRPFRLQWTITLCFNDTKKGKENNIYYVSIFVCFWWLGKIWQK